MSTLVSVSEAASLALHTMSLLASDPAKVAPTKEIAKVLRASEAHLSKVLQRLRKAGLVQSVRGPSGGFVVAKPSDQVTLLEVYEAIEGPLASSSCLFSTPICSGRECVLGGLLTPINKQARDYLARTTLSMLTGVFGDNQPDRR